MRRRDFLAASAGFLSAGIAGSARAQRRDPKVLKFVPQANLTSLDPIWTTAQVTTNHGYAVFDTLYGLDNALRPQPQMAKGHSVSTNGRVWTVELREGLTWHDGQPVLARDCIASLQRWAKRDAFGQLLDAMADTWEALDDKRFRVTFRSAFPLFLEALAKPLGITPFMMPERVARTDPFKQITEIVGSGPYRFLQNEYVSGSKAAYARFDAYVPRPEPAERTAGGKSAHFERIEWIVMPDAATAAAALQTGEIDWWDQVLPDLLPVLQSTNAIKVAVHDRAGFIGMMRFNTLHPPFDNPAIRRAIMFARAGRLYALGHGRHRPELPQLLLDVAMRHELCRRSRRRATQGTARPRARQGNAAGGRLQGRARGHHQPDRHRQHRPARADHRRPLPQARDQCRAEGNRLGLGRSAARLARAGR